MQKLVIGTIRTANKFALGFTLIEILVVLVIVGITLSFAILSFGDFGESRRILMAAYNVQNTIKVAQQQAILESTTLGLRITNTHYQVFKFQPTLSWAPISDKNVFKEQSFPKQTLVKLEIASKAQPGAPDIVFNSSGEMTPFKLILGNAKNPQLITLSGLPNGQLILNKPT